MLGMWMLEVVCEMAVGMGCLVGWRVACRDPRAPDTGVEVVGVQLSVWVWACGRAGMRACGHV